MNNLIGHKKIHIFSYCLFVILASLLLMFFYSGDFLHILFAACGDGGGEGATTTTKQTTTTKSTTTTKAGGGGCGSSPTDETGTPPNGGGDGGCPPPAECTLGWVNCRLCNENLQCVSEKVCGICPSGTCALSEQCISASNKTTYNACINGSCKSVQSNYTAIALQNECDDAGGSCTPSCRHHECEYNYTVDPITGKVTAIHTCRLSDFATSDECTKPSDCVPGSGGDGNGGNGGNGDNGGGLKLCKVCIQPMGFSQKKCLFKVFNVFSCSQVTSLGYTRCTSDAECQFAPPPPITPPITPPVTIPECEITKFEIPHHAWIGYDVLAEWSTNEDCTWGEITCKLTDGNDCGDRETLSGQVPVGFSKEKLFQIFEPGIYQYQLKACGDYNCDIWIDRLGTGLDYIEVQALNLPWWQEIIPVLPDKLQGFLRGLIQ